MTILKKKGNRFLFKLDIDQIALIQLNLGIHFFSHKKKRRTVGFSKNYVQPGLHEMYVT